MANALTKELRKQLDTLPREGAHILHPDGETPTWCYDPSYFAAAINKAGISLLEVARRAGWADDAYVSRKLGMRPYRAGDGKDRVAQVITYDSALKLARAIGLEFTEVGV